MSYCNYYIVNGSFSFTTVDETSVCYNLDESYIVLKCFGLLCCARQFELFNVCCHLDASYTHIEW